MRNLRTPGVYIREVEVKPPPSLRMDITGFVGQSERGPLNLPQPLSGLGEYREIFGDFTGYSYLSYCVYSFFANGGEKCYVVRVAHESDVTDESAAKSSLVLNSTSKDENGDPIPFARVQAINEGVWGDSIEVAAEGESTGDLVLTELESALNAGSTIAKFKSVAGLLGSDIAGQGKGDSIKLIHPTIAALQEPAVIKSIDFVNRTAEFEKPVSSKFPSGSHVLGKGFKLIFRYLRNGQLVRGELFDNLSLDLSHERYFVRMINGEPEEPDYIKRLRAGYSILVRVTDLCENNENPCGRIENRTINENRTLNLSKGRDGDRSKVKATSLTGYKGGEYFRPVLPPGADPEVVRKHQERLFGLASYEAVDEIGLVVIADLTVPDFYAAVAAGNLPIPEQGIIFATIPKAQQKFDNLKAGQADMLFHCQRMGERFAILDSPRGAEVGRGENRIDEWPSNYRLLSTARYGALYYPWVRHKAADFDGRDLFIPPSGQVAGVYSRSEQQRGVGKAPANELLQGVVELEFCLGDDEQAILNPIGINCLRNFPGRGLRVWGGRTLSLDPLSRYVNIRRVVLATIKDILVNLRWTVFEPNDRRLWNEITATLKLFLTRLFESGALAGASPEEAFYVKCDEETNPPEVVELGQVITLIGFAPERPAEFILVTIKRSPGALSVLERSA
jgi:Phage tail sheath protein subtilisin-like domain/Phage tail sheath C-terminal domain